MTCKHCWIVIPEELYEKVAYPSGANIDELHCCLVCRHSDLDEFAKMESESCKILKVHCVRHNSWFPADAYCEEFMTQMDYDECQDAKDRIIEAKVAVNVPNVQQFPFDPY